MSETSPPLLSIVIPAYNEEKLLPGTLEALKRAVQVLPSWEIIVSNNNSTDQTAAVAEAAGVKVVFEPINQISRARNRGASAATGEWILFLDADSTATPELLSELRETLERGKAVGGGTLLKADGTWLFRRVMGFWNLVSRIKKDAAGAFFFARRDAFEAVGGFSGELFVAEEIELASRLKRWGKARKLAFVILTKNKLWTSDRKVKLYSPWEFASFFLKSAFSGLRNIRRKEDCGIWYDGRR
jgi:glycosyltransferase involved in cell wall biosynthesis